MEPIAVEATVNCFHCGDNATYSEITDGDKIFCCEGCKTVYGIINGNGLCDYYNLESNPGTKIDKEFRKGKFSFLNDADVLRKLLTFQNDTESRVTLYLPQMHCSSCVWLLEKLHKINKGIIQSQVNFLKKEINIRFQHHETTLEKVAEALQYVGYDPYISMHDVKTGKKVLHNKKQLYKIGVAGFCFGNIMLLSFPEYFSEGAPDEGEYYRFFSWLNLFLGSLTFFYSSSDFFISSYKSLKQKFLNIDAPIALAILITYLRSVFEIIGGSGEGYLDSMSGIVFFMLVGRYFQNLTYDSLSFERDYESYFPLGVTIINEDRAENQVPVAKLKPGDRIKIHHGEIIPTDSILFYGKAHIDYSFVSGESLPVEKGIGEIIYAGGKQTQGALELEVVKEVTQSYLTQLWNNEAFKRSGKDEEKVSFIHRLSTWFTYILFSIAGITAIYWWYYNPNNILNTITATLIVACPCALLLSATFTNGNILRYMGRAKFYARNANVVEQMAEATALVFDKTGTVTYQQSAQIHYSGQVLSQEEITCVKNLTAQSNHPLSMAIYAQLPNTLKKTITSYQEIKNKGISGKVGTHFIQMGSLIFTGAVDTTENSGSKVWLNINGEVKGCYSVINNYRDGLKNTISKLKNKYKIFILSGDNESEKQKLKEFFGQDVPMFFNQSPHDKLHFIKKIQNNGEKVIMMGDGLNDAGALKESFVGVSITDHSNNFTPACDAILHGTSFKKIPGILRYAQSAKRIIIASFIISILYNIIGLSFAVQGLLKPVVAAILMPASSISIILFTSGLAWYYSYNLKNKNNGNANSY